MEHFVVCFNPDNEGYFCIIMSERNNAEKHHIILHFRIIFKTNKYYVFFYIITVILNMHTGRKQSRHQTSNLLKTQLWQYRSES